MVLPLVQVFKPLTDLIDHAVKTLRPESVERYARERLIDEATVYFDELVGTRSGLFGEVPESFYAYHPYDLGDSVLFQGNEDDRSAGGRLRVKSVHTERGYVVSLAGVERETVHYLLDEGVMNVKRRLDFGNVKARDGTVQLCGIVNAHYETTGDRVLRLAPENEETPALIFKYGAFSSCCNSRDLGATSVSFDGNGRPTVQADRRRARVEIEHKDGPLVHVKASFGRWPVSFDLPLTIDPLRFLEESKNTALQYARWTPGNRHVTYLKPE